MPEADESVLDVGLVFVVDGGRGVQGELELCESARRVGAWAAIQPAIPVLRRESRGVRGVRREQVNHGPCLSRAEEETS